MKITIEAKEKKNKTNHGNKNKKIKQSKPESSLKKKIKHMYCNHH